MLFPTVAEQGIALGILGMLSSQDMFFWIYVASMGNRLI